MNVECVDVNVEVRSSVYVQKEWNNYENVFNNVHIENLSNNVHIENLSKGERQDGHPGEKQHREL